MSQRNSRLPDHPVVNEHPQCYPDLGEFTPKDGKPYRPSNGTEGDMFQEGWCAHCKRDKAFRADPDREEGCNILARSMAYSVGEQGYPVEWIWQRGRPVCTAFDDEALQITNAELDAIYKRLRSEAHPDRPGGNAERFNDVQRAYEQAAQELRT